MLVAIGRLGRRGAARRSSLSLSDDGTGCLDPECPAWHAATAAPQRDGRIVAAIPQRSFTLGLPLHCAPCCIERCSVNPGCVFARFRNIIINHLVLNYLPTDRRWPQTVIVIGSHFCIPRGEFLYLHLRSPSIIFRCRLTFTFVQAHAQLVRLFARCCGD